MTECQDDCADHVQELLEQIETLQSQLDAEIKKNRWIPVGERLPDLFDVPHSHSKRVLICVEEDITEMAGEVSIGYYSKEKGWRTDYDLSMLKVTHWRLIDLPEGA